MQKQEESFIQEFENTETQSGKNFLKKWLLWVIVAVVVLIGVVVVVLLMTKQKMNTNPEPVLLDQQYGLGQPDSRVNEQETVNPIIYKAKFVLETDDHNWKVGDQVDVRITMDTMGSNVVAAQAVVNYDPKLLELVKVNNKSSVLTMDAIEKNEEGRVEVVRGIIGDSNPKDSDDGFTGIGNFSTLKFKVIKAGNFDVEFDRGNSMIVVDDGKGTVMQTEFVDFKF